MRIILTYSMPMWGRVGHLSSNLFQRFRFPRTTASKAQAVQPGPLFCTPFTNEGRNKPANQTTSAFSCCVYYPVMGVCSPHASRGCSGGGGPFEGEGAPQTRPVEQRARRQ